MEVDGWVGVSGAETNRRETMKQARDQQRQNRRQKWHVGTNRRQLCCVRETKQGGCGFVSQSGKRVFSWSIPYCCMQLTISLADTYTLETHVLSNEVKIRVCTHKHRLFVYGCLFVRTCVCAYYGLQHILDEQKNWLLQHAKLQLWLWVGYSDYR